MWTINGINYNVPPKTSAVVAIDAATQLGFDIPRFCYHEGLKIAGNCRMCSIEDSKAAKPVVSCAMSVINELEIFTNTVRVKKARESVMEFLLINHPLDCPICDQGGECDLQDLSVVYGSDHGRFYEYKRNVEDKNCGPIVKTLMNRCILCTRCVRFATDVAGFSGFGVTGRGAKSEIGSYVEKLLDTDLSGNLVDVCPVGALTSKPYAFVARPWEIKRLTTINILDDDIQLIRADVKENELIRILPAKDNESTNMWITNRVRFSYEGLTRARLLAPLLFNKPSTWLLSLTILFKSLIQISSSKIFTGVIKRAEKTLSNESLVTIKNMRSSLAFDYVSDTNKSLNYTLNLSQRQLLDNFEVVWILNTNFEIVAPIFALQVKQTEKTVVTWGSHFISTPHTVTVHNQTKTMVESLRNKTWHSLLSLKKLLVISLCPTGLYSLMAGQKNPIINLSSSPTLRAEHLFNFKQVHQQNFALSAYNLSYSFGSFSSKSESIVPLVQNSHFIPSFTSVALILPSNTMYEESKKSYFDTDYNIRYSTRVIAAEYKSPLSIIRAIGQSLTKKNKSLNEDGYLSQTCYYSPKRSILLALIKNKVLDIVFTCVKDFAADSKKDYYAAHPLTYSSVTLRYNDKQNIYIK